MHHRYVIIGGGLAAAAAIEGIRAHDSEGGIALYSRENHLPYHRPPLTKDVWADGYDMERLSIHPASFYEQHRVDVQLRREIVELDADNKVLWDESGESVGFEHVLFATGARPRRLETPGSELSSVRYFRDLEDYLDLRRRMDRLQHITIAGACSTGLEMCAALRSLGKEVTIAFGEEYPLHRVLPRAMGLGLMAYLRELDVETVSGESLVSIEETGAFVHARTTNGYDLTTQLVLVDIGNEAQLELAEASGLDTDNGIVVDEYGHGSKPGVWAAGDVAEFPYLALGQLMRVEGSEHAEQHGRAVGANMAGAGRAYDHLPLKWFRVGELQFEGVGELNARMQAEEFWIVPGREGIALYLQDDIVRGVLMCNVHERLEWARDLIREARPRSAADRAALLPARA